MKGLQVGVYLVGAVLLGVGVAMGITNPNQESYDQYATRQLTTYLKENACTKPSGTFSNFLREQCGILLERNQDAIRRLISENTKRQNFVVLSIYKTDLAIPELASVLPSYHFESVGVFQTFHTYKVEKQGN